MRLCSFTQLFLVLLLVGHLFVASGCRAMSCCPAGTDSQAQSQVQPVTTLKPPTPEQVEYYDLDPGFYTKAFYVQDILIATSAKVSDEAIYESAYLFDEIMKSIDPAVAQRIRDRKLLCLLIAHNEQLSDLPQYRTELTGEEKDFYNWRGRGFLGSREIDGRRQQVVVFAEEDVMEYPGGMQDESILVHEFGHVIMGLGFSPEQQQQVTACYQNALANNLYNDGYPAQRFRRIKGVRPVLLLDALAQSFPDQPRELLAKCLDSGDITVNGKPTDQYIVVSEKDQILIHFGGEKDCYARLNRAEYFAEIVQAWYDTNRTRDHDHNHIHTRQQLKQYDPMGAALCQEVLGDGEWRFVSPRSRAGQAHLKDFDPAMSPQVTQPKNIEDAGLNYFDTYWAPYWERLSAKHARPGE